MIGKLRTRLSKAETNLKKVLHAPRRDPHQVLFARRRVLAARRKLAQARRAHHGHTR